MPVIATNTAANSALNYLNRNSREQMSSLQKIASGSRIVTAKDDAAGLGVTTQINADIVTLVQAGINMKNGQAVLQTADGALARIGDILTRMKSLAASAVSGAVDATSRGYIDSEFQDLITEIDEIASSTRFNGATLIDGSFDEDFLAGDDSGDVISADLTTIDFSTIATTGDVTSQANATAAMDNIDTDLEAVSDARALLGALSSRMQFRNDVIDTAVENLTAAKSAMADTDIAEEQTRLTSYQVLTEAAIASLAQANNMKTSLLSLVR